MNENNNLLIYKNKEGYNLDKIIAVGYLNIKK